MKQTVCMCISVCLYMWAYMCIHTVPVDLVICLCDPCNCTYTEEGETLCHDLCPHKNQWDCEFRMQTNADRCPWKNVSALFLAFDGEMSCPAPSPLSLRIMAYDGSGNWVSSSDERQRTSVSALPLCGPACRSWQDPDWMGWWRSISSVVCGGAEFAAEALEGSAAVALPLSCLAP